MSILDLSSLYFRELDDYCPDCGMAGAHFCPGKPSPIKNRSYTWPNKQKEEKNEKASEESS